jgi:hypothetical protein
MDVAVAWVVIVSSAPAAVAANDTNKKKGDS